MNYLCSFCLSLLTIWDSGESPHHEGHLEEGSTAHAQSQCHEIGWVHLNLGTVIQTLFILRVGHVWRRRPR